jgi:hypothetical protein
MTNHRGKLTIQKHTNPPATPIFPRSYRIRHKISWKWKFITIKKAGCGRMARIKTNESLHTCVSMMSDDETTATAMNGK